MALPASLALAVDLDLVRGRLDRLDVEAGVEAHLHVPAVAVRRSLALVGALDPALALGLGRPGLVVARADHRREVELEAPVLPRHRLRILDGDRHRLSGLPFGRSNGFAFTIGVNYVRYCS